MTAELETDVMDVTVSPKNKDTNWVALDENYHIIAEGVTADETIEKADKITSNYFMMFTPKPGQTYIY